MYTNIMCAMSAHVTGGLHWVFNSPIPVQRHGPVVVESPIGPVGAQLEQSPPMLLFEANSFRLITTMMSSRWAETGPPSSTREVGRPMHHLVQS